MTRSVAALYHIHHPDISTRIRTSLNRGQQRAPGRPQVFFRADDIGYPSSNFSLMIDCFRHHNLPLCLACVPAWMSASRRDELQRATGPKSNQWCWHQHGFAHHNHERTGKKQEFGPSRKCDAIVRNLKQGKEKLEQLLDQQFRAVFTPPWNRCSADTLDALTALRFAAISRSRDAQPVAPDNLPDFQVNIDLHTRRERDPQQSLAALLGEIEDGLATGRAGIMLHHQRMNRTAFAVLDILLAEIAGMKNIVPVHFADLLKENSSTRCKK